MTDWDMALYFDAFPEVIEYNPGLAAGIQEELMDCKKVSSLKDLPLSLFLCAIP